MVPTLLQFEKGDIEVSTHIVSGTVKREVDIVFPNQACNAVVAVPTCQRARFDLVNIGPEIEAEKDRLLELFMEFSGSVASALQARGFWVDYIDPCSGLPVMDRDCNKFYDEVSGAQALLRYDVMNAGCCKVLLHPTWGSAVYPATLFTSAPESEIEAVLQKYPRV